MIEVVGWEGKIASRPENHRSLDMTAQFLTSINLEKHTYIC
jgi:hypothetical protein